MKIIRRIFIWILISVVLQTVIYFYLDRYYFSDETSVKITDINDINKSDVIKCSLKLPDEAKNIDLSYDAVYAAYLNSSNEVVIEPTVGDGQEKVPVEAGAQCIAYKWLPDADIMVLAELNGRIIRLYSFDADKNEKKVIGSKDTSINARADDPEVTIEDSTLIGVMYVKVNSNGSSALYRIDRNESMSRVSTYSSKIGDFKVASHDDLIAYEDLSSGTVRTTGERKILKLDNKTNLQLLDSDGNDNVYAGNNVDGKVSKITYGKLSDDATKWTTIALSAAVNPDQIIISYNKGIYVFVNGVIVNLSTNAQTSYSGRLLGIKGDYLVSINNNKLAICKLN